jgi:hypothetical protein
MEKLLKNSLGQWKLIKTDDPGFNHRAAARLLREQQEKILNEGSNRGTPSAETNVTPTGSNAIPPAKPNVTPIGSNATPSAETNVTPTKNDLHNATFTESALDGLKATIARRKAERENSQNTQQEKAVEELTPTPEWHDEHFKYRKDPNWSDLLTPYHNDKYRGALSDPLIGKNGVHRQYVKKKTTVIKRNPQYSEANDPESPDFKPGTENYGQKKYIKEQIDAPTGLAHFEKDYDNRIAKGSLDLIHNKAKDMFSKKDYDHGNEKSTINSARRDRLKDIAESDRPDAQKAKKLINEIDNVLRNKNSAMQMQYADLQKYQKKVNESNAHKEEVRQLLSYLHKKDQTKELSFLLPRELWDPDINKDLTPKQIYDNIMKNLDQKYPSSKKLAMATQERFEEYQRRLKEAEQDHKSRRYGTEDKEKNIETAKEDFINGNRFHLFQNALSRSGNKLINGNNKKFWRSIISRYGLQNMDNW